MENDKNSLIKKWWFWIIIVVILGGIVGISQTTESDNSIDPVVKNVDVTNNKAKNKSDKPITSNKVSDTATDTTIEYRNLKNTVWEPNMVSYPNNQYPDNPVLTITDISEDYTEIQFKDSDGIFYSASICAGWNNPGVKNQETFEKGYGVQYLFEESAPFYGLTLYGYREDDNEWEPTIFVQRENFNNIYTDPIYKIVNSGE